MSKAYKCDRCGKFYDKKLRSDQTIKFNFIDGLNDLPVYDVLLTVNLIKETKLTLDLCPSCLDEFCMWYNMKE